MKTVMEHYLQRPAFDSHFEERQKQKKELEKRIYANLSMGDIDALFKEIFMKHKRKPGK